MSENSIRLEISSGENLLITVFFLKRKNFSKSIVVDVNIAYRDGVTPLAHAKKRSRMR